MEVEHTVKVFPLDAELENNIKAMTAEGWLLLPGVPPVAIYHCVRIKGIVASPDIDGHKPVAQINIDETKVHIMRDGQLVNG
jgi:hypothetical protein